MGYLSKEAYERKNEYAARRMHNNAQIDSLTEEQHEFLAELCEFRHELHCNQNALFLSECADYNRYWNYISELSNKASAVGLQFNGYDEDTGIELVSDSYYDYDISEDDYESEDDYVEAKEEAYNDAQIEVLKFAQKLNFDIEKFLAKIDAEHGTDYCPAGATRIY